MPDRVAIVTGAAVLLEDLDDGFGDLGQLSDLIG